MSEERNWGAEAWRQPTLAPGDTMVFSECGRVIYREERGQRQGTDCRSHWFCLVRQKFGGYALLVKHGGGEERVNLGYDYKMAPIAAGMALMDSDARYWLLHQFLDVHRDAASATESKYRTAFVNGTLKKKVVKGGTSRYRQYRVWIEAPAAEKREAA